MNFARQINCWLILILCITACTLQASGPISHVYFSMRLFHYFPEYFNETEQKEFLLGTLFPDIRYLGKISRDKTHLKGVTLTSVLYEPSSFKAGMKYHAWVDEQRSVFVNHHPMSRKVYQYTTTHHHFFLKMIEDQLTYPNMNYSFTCELLKDIHPEELTWGMDEETIKHWHFLNSLALANPPTTLLFLLSSCNKGIFNIAPSTIHQWHSKMLILTKTQEMKHYVYALNGHFESLLQQQAVIENNRKKDKGLKGH